MDNYGLVLALTGLAGWGSISATSFFAGGVMMPSLMYRGKLNDMRVGDLLDNVGTGFGPMACVAFGLKLRA
jgi:hypothetical protein